MRKYILFMAPLTTIVVLFLMRPLFPAAPSPSLRQQAVPDGTEIFEAPQKAQDAGMRAWRESRALPPSERAEKVLDAFLKAADLRPEMLNVEALQRAPRQEAINVSQVGLFLRYYTGLAATRDDVALLDAARKRGIAIEADPGAALNARLTPLADAERPRIILEYLATLPRFTPLDQMMVAPVVDGGRAARRQARRLLQELTARTAKGETIPGGARAALQAVLEQLPQGMPTSPAAQGKVGRMDPKRGYVPAAPDRLPRLTPGQQFLAWGREELTLKDKVSGKPLDRKSYLLRPLTLTRIERPGSDRLRLTFSIPGLPHPALWEGDGDLYELPDLAPIVEDDAVRALRTRYAGRQVFGYGGIGLNGIGRDPGMQASVGMSGDQPVTVRQLYRVRLSQPEILDIGTSPGYAGERASTFACRDPLLVVVDAPKGTRFDSWSVGGAPTLDDDDFDLSDPTAALKSLSATATPPDTLGFYDVRADTWDFERTYSLKSRRQVSATWSRRLRDASRRGSLVKGMTPLMVVWTMGWPGEYATKDTLFRNPKQWRYDDIPPHDFTIFFKQGRVSGWDRYRMP